MKHITIYKLMVQNKKTGFEFSEGCYSNQETASQHKEVAEEINGDKYHYFIEEDLLFIDEDQIKNYLKTLLDSIF